MTLLFWVLVFSFMYLVSVYPTNRTLETKNGQKLNEVYVLQQALIFLLSNKKIDIPSAIFRPNQNSPLCQQMIIHFFFDHRLT